MFWMSFDDFRKHFVSIDVCAPYLVQAGCTLAMASKLKTTPSIAGLPADAGKDPNRYVPPRIRPSAEER